MLRNGHSRPSSDEYYMGIAMAVRRRANCKGSRVGAILVLEDRIIATGYNGTPEDTTNCDEGGCYRCNHRDEFKSGEGYDVCVCVHAEHNALLTCARFGHKVDGSTLYTTYQPCFTCTKALLQAKVKSVYYCHGWTHPNPDLKDDYAIIQARFPGGCKQFPMEDPEELWAHPRTSSKTL